MRDALEHSHQHSSLPRVKCVYILIILKIALVCDETTQHSQQHEKKRMKRNTVRVCYIYIYIHIQSKMLYKYNMKKKSMLGRCDERFAKF